MEFNFKKFTNTHAKIEERISITNSGAIGFPKKFYEDEGISKYRYITLYYDAKKMAVGILFTNDTKEKDRFTIVHSKKGYGASVVIRSFFKVCNIKPTNYSGRYHWGKEPYDDVGELYVIKLEEREKEKM